MGKLMLILVCAAMTVTAQTANAPEVTMRFSSDRILLGEPVWVLVTAHNGSDVTITWNPGDYCYLFDQAPVTAVAPAATQGSAKPQRCEYGRPGGNCLIGGSTTDLAPGTSATWQYLLEGDFHFTQPGKYQVLLTSHPGVPFQPGSHPEHAPTPPPAVTQTLTLEVLPKDDAALLAREKQMATQVELEMAPGKPQPASMEERATQWIHGQDVRQLRHGLATQPVPGMEPVFVHWLDVSNDFDYDAVAGLKNLDTKASRAALAQIANTPNKPNSYLQEAATAALSEIGDRSNFPLMVKLADSTNARVRRAAIFGEGRLGGDAAVPRLVETARTGSKLDQSDAVYALGETRSRLAVRGLIDLMTPETGIDPWGLDWEIFVLTHHRLPQVTYLRTVQQMHDEWEQWWKSGSASALVYSPFECAPKQAALGAPGGF